MVLVQTLFDPFSPSSWARIDSGYEEELHESSHATFYLVVLMEIFADRLFGVGRDVVEAYLRDIDT